MVLTGGDGEASVMTTPPPKPGLSRQTSAAEHGPDHTQLSAAKIALIEVRARGQLSVV